MNVQNDKPFLSLKIRKENDFQKIVFVNILELQKATAVMSLKYYNDFSPEEIS